MIADRLVLFPLDSFMSIALPGSLHGLAWLTPGSCLVHSRNFLGSLQGLAWLTPGTFLAHSRVLPASLQGLAWLTPESCYDH